MNSIDENGMKAIFCGLALVVLCAHALAATATDTGTGMTNATTQVSASISPQAARPVVTAAPDHFIGTVHVAPLFSATAPSRTSAAYVTFEPGARTDWHTHPVGQRLVVTAGSGYVQFWGGAIQRITVGDVVWIPPGQKHWHGASASEAMTHLAIQESVEGSSVNWMEKVSDQQYGAAQANQVATPNAPTATTTMSASRAQQLMGDVAPKLAELTDQVLYQDIWERPGLSKRDRSLVTVSALIALNRPDQLRSHLALALKNGVTQDELSETITQLAFYAGWPSAISAVSVAREVFPQKPVQP